MANHLNTLRQLVITADDFGLAPGVDHGILEAFRRDIARSTAPLAWLTQLSGCAKNPR
jgi:predicted glycoside hydrolase/deacetylase ChbG (UPF0249 family)